MASKLLPGRPFPLGATWDGSGVNFAIFSETAERIELCLFNDLAEPETERIPLVERTNYTWHGYLRNMVPGQLYAYRVFGPYDPEQGLRFDPAKLVLDPYAKALAGQVEWTAPVFPYKLGGPAEDLAKDDHDDVLGMQKCVIVNPYFDWEEDRPLKTPLAESIIYELHVKGFTKRHPDIPEELRGTYAGLASRPAIQYLKKLGITA